ncbi:SMP-30/gluconolactonase/LRE family protein [Amycolatopsis panacis]|uniref:SMP-30/gluconolactonase/LRE family protein n=1 Tax=Amycolatopsis panacis TaxID=2340917 RepID=A0A419HJF9_9PSEU|nr:SMP-30/gluconolactonase/LRE family protein [Amycolatopsis panacis]RJQ75915.1 SMP-30/gluconolactonase/LRE family protein [Amycolatopsis panacis]
MPSAVVLDGAELVWAESPRWREGRLWVSDTQGCRLVVIGADGTRVHPLDTPVNGTGFLPSGELVAARMHVPRLDRFDGHDWSVHADLARLVDGRLGDLIALPDGTVYVDEVRTPDEPGRLLKVEPGGSASVAAGELVFPNGLAVIGEGRTLIVAETFAGRLTAFTIGPDGNLGDRRMWFDLKEKLGARYLPDGIWACRDGSVWVATTTGHAFLRIRDGDVVDRIDVDGFAIACCLNEDETDLYATTATSLDPGIPVTEAVREQRTQARVTRFSPGRNQH